ncbi:hypothetical protein [Streptomyces sp. NBC_01003]|uniref:hypothetical protein n=1 Tax=Streptomyces sp. NBC_01003 TaxID=2903714 RepID=UPI00386DA927
MTRAFVHEHFRSLDAVGQSLVPREADRFLLGIVAELRKHPDDLGRGTAEGIGFAPSLAADNPLLTSVLTSNVGEDRILVARIATRSEQIFDSACTLIADYVGKASPTIPDERRRLMVDAVVRMAISHIVALALPPEQTARDIADIAVHVAGTRAGAPTPPEVRPVLRRAGQRLVRHRSTGQIERRLGAHAVSVEHERLRGVRVDAGGRGVRDVLGPVQRRLPDPSSIAGECRGGGPDPGRSHSLMPRLPCSRPARPSPRAPRGRAAAPC